MSAVIFNKGEVLLAFPEKEAPLGFVDILAGLGNSTF
jgi:hypothetical protein